MSPSHDRYHSQCAGGPCARGSELANRTVIRPMTSEPKKQRVVWSVTPEQTRSPYIKQLVVALRELGWQVDDLSLQDLARTKRQLVHVQWPEHISRAPEPLRTAAKHVRASALLLALKLRRHRVIVTAHNLAPHTKSDAFDHWFRMQIFKVAAAVIVLVPEHEAALRERGQLAEHSVVHAIRHPVPNETEEAPRDSSPTSLMILGMVHPYHRILEFVDALIATGSDRTVEVVGGVADQHLAEQLVERSHDHDWLRVHARYVSDSELEPMLAKTAAVVSLQQNPFNSGGPFFALARAIPVIMTEGAQAKSLRRELGDEWVFEVPTDETQLDLPRLDTWIAVARSAPDLSLYRAAVVAEAHAETYQTLF